MASIPHTRRSLIGGSLALSSALIAAPALAVPAFARSGRPDALWGVQSGEITAHSATVWTRSDRLARMYVETSPSEAFRYAVRRHRGPLLGPSSDFTGTTVLRDLPPGQQIHYRVVLTDPDDPRRSSSPVQGTFRTTPVSRRHDVRFLWSGDLAGQGWGINPDLGGYRVFEEMRQRNPDFFLFSGDTIYADGPIGATAPLRDGSLWRNVTTEEKAKVAETLAEFRGNFRYNLLDCNLLGFNAQVPVLAQWDDHEVRNNWYPGQLIDDPRYTVKEADILAARARQAFGEYFPVTDLRGGRAEGRMYRVMRYGPLLDVFVLDMRTYRNANSPVPRPRTPSASSAPSSWPGSSASCPAPAPPGRSSPPTCRWASSSPTGPRTSRPSPRATRAPRSAASCRSPNS